MQKNIVPIILCFILLLPLPAKSAEVETLEQTVQAMQTALDTADLPAFEMHADIDAITSQCSAVFVNLLEKNGQQAANLSPVLALLAISVANPENAVRVRQSLAAQAAAFTRNGIKSGLFGGKQQSATQDANSLFADVSRGRKIIRIAGKTPSPGSKTTVSLPITIKDEGNGHTYPLTLHMEKTMLNSGRNVWRAVSIADLQNIADRIWKEAISRR